jgi:predicted transcriptional regulator YdeE
LRRRGSLCWEGSDDELRDAGRGEADDRWAQRSGFECGRVQDRRPVAQRTSDAAYAVYCEYEGDHTQAFTAVIGCAVAPDAAVPEGMRKITIEAGRFAVYQPAGEMPQAVFDTWAEIWGTPLERRYQADYDRYGGGPVEIHVGVR